MHISSFEEQKRNICRRNQGLKNLKKLGVHGSFIVLVNSLLIDTNKTFGAAAVVVDDDDWCVNN